MSVAVFWATRFAVEERFSHLGRGSRGAMDEERDDRRKQMMFAMGHRRSLERMVTPFGASLRAVWSCSLNLACGTGY